MNSSDQTPKLPTWTFIVTDVVLLATAVLIAARSHYPFSALATAAIVACVLVGAIVLLVPLIARFERAKNEALDERQRALEALARTVSGTAEQISIATGSLHEIAEVTQRNLRQAEQLPHKLQDKIAEFQAQLANATDAEKEELEKELAELRGSETERMQTLADKIARATAELAKLEAATHQHLTVANEAVAKLSLGTASAIGKAQAAAEQALAQGRTEAARHVGDAAGAAIAQIDAHLATASTAAVERLARDFAAKLAPTLAALEEKLARAGAGLRRGETLAAPAPAAAAASPSHAAADAAATTANGAAPAPAASVAATPKPARKPRREESAAAAAAAETAAPASARESAELDSPEPPPVPSHAIAEIAPVAPETAEPFHGTISSRATVAEPPVSSAASIPLEPPAAETPKPVRKRAPKKPEPAPDAVLDLGIGASDTPGEERTRAEMVERVLSSDGATRLLVTAYIGIGNRLFIRGEGPGLSWDKGVPLQFVSIGKWRWETDDATAPVRFKLLKNDEAECTALGEQSLEPGHQQEVTAVF